MKSRWSRNSILEARVEVLSSLNSRQTEELSFSGVEPGGVSPAEAQESQAFLEQDGRGRDWVSLAEALAFSGIRSLWLAEGYTLL